MFIRSIITIMLALMVTVITPFASAQTTNPPERSGTGFTYFEKIENAGSKSAGVRGILLYKGRYIQPLGGTIKTPIGSFVYVASPMLFRPQGWFPTEDIVVGNIPESISEAVLQEGQYNGARRIGTPEDWCYLAGSDTWIAPQKLQTKEFSDLLFKEQPETSGGTISASKAPKPENSNCLLKPERGPCKALMEGFYYDGNSSSCKTFFWGGCQGVVPFHTLEECQTSCQKAGGK